MSSAAVWRRGLAPAWVRFACFEAGSLLAVALRRQTLIAMACTSPPAIQTPTPGRTVTKKDQACQ